MKPFDLARPIVPIHASYYVCMYVKINRETYIPATRAEASNYVAVLLYCDIPRLGIAMRYVRMKSAAESRSTAP